MSFMTSDCELRDGTLIVINSYQLSNSPACAAFRTCLSVVRFHNDVKSTKAEVQGRIQIVHFTQYSRLGCLVNRGIFLLLDLRLSVI